MGVTNAASIMTIRTAEAQAGLFLMVNTFETGGSERQFSMLAQAATSRFQVHLGCINPRGPLADEFKSVTQFPVGGSLFGWKSLRARIDLARHLRQTRVQIAHSFDFYTNLILIPAAKLARVPVVIGSHRQLGDLMTPAQFRAQAEAFRWSDAVVCNSRAGANRLSEAGLSPAKLVVIGNALAAPLFEIGKPALAARPGVLRVGMVARMNAHYKNHAGFVRIAAKIHERLPQTEFVLVGDGPLRPEIERQAAELGLSERMIFLGDRRDIPDVLASIDVAVLTSDSEGLSNVILEAMAVGLPVVAYNVGGNAELVDAGRGMLIEAGNEGEFASAVCRLLSDEGLRRQQGTLARKFAEENFTTDRVWRKNEEMYLRLLNKKLEREPKA